MQEILIEDVIAVSKIEGDVERVIASLRKLDENIDALSKKSIGAAQITSLRDLRKAVDDLNGIAQTLSRGLLETAAATAKVGENTKKTVDAYGLLKKEYADSERFARNMAAIYGAQSKQALDAAAAAQVLKKRLDEVEAVTITPKQMVATEPVGGADKEQGEQTAAIDKKTKATRQHTEAIHEQKLEVDSLTASLIALLEKRDKPMPSGFNLYMGQNMKGGKTHKEVADEWNNLDASTKAAYNNAVAIDKRNRSLKDGVAIQKEANEQEEVHIQHQQELQEETKKVTKTEEVSVTTSIKPPDLTPYDKLKKDIKEAEANARNLALEFGVDSKQAQEAANKVFELKTRLQEVDALTKQRKEGAKVVPFTTNLDALKQEREALDENTTAINEHDKAEADAAMSANEWAAAQQLVNDENLKVAEGLERIKTPFEDYTGTLQQNVLQNKEYKDRIAEISAEIKLLDKTYTDAEKSTDAYKNKVAALLEEQSILKSSSSELGRVILQQSNYVKSAEGSYDQMAATLELALRAQKQMTAEEKQSTFGQQLQRTINELDASLKEQDAQMGVFRRNVGNYAGSLGGFFDKLTEEIQRLKKEQQGLLDLSQRDPIGFKIGGGASRQDEITSQLKTLQNVQQVGFQLTSDPAQQINTLTQAMEQFKESGVESKDVIEALSQAIRQIKLPDYRGNFKGAFQVLTNELNGVRQKLLDPALKGEELKKLQQEEKLLTQLTSSLSKEFTSTRTEFRAVQEAAKQLGLNLGTSSELFIQFSEAAGQAKDSLGDIDAVINQNASDTKHLDSAISAANGLAGAYGAAEGAAQLFGGETQNLQKQMVKLQAILTIINGLQAVQNALQAESGVMQSILAAKMGLLNAARSVQAAIFAQAAVATQADAVAQTEDAAATSANAVAAEANAVAHAESAVATEASAVAMEGEAVAANTATVATSRFRLALIASGIGAAILAIGAAVVFLMSKMSDWLGTSTRAIKMQNDLTESIKKTNDILIEQTQLIASADQTLKNYLQKQLDFSQAAGENIYKQFAIRKQLYKEDERLAQDQIDALGATNAQQALLLSNIENINNRILILQAKREQQIKAGQQDEAEVTAGAIANFEKDKERYVGIYQAGQEARTALFNARKNQGQLEIEQAKFSADEQRRITLETARITATAIIENNQRVLSNDKSTQADRIAALRSTAQQEKAIKAAELAAVVNDPSKKGTSEEVIARKNYAAAVQKIEKDLQVSVYTVRRDYRLRDLEAEKSRFITEKQLRGEFYKSISEDLNFSLEERLASQQQYSAAQKAILDKEFEVEKAKASYKNLTDAEKLQMEKDYETKVMRLTLDTNKSVTEIIRQEIDKQQRLREISVDNINRIFSRVDLGTSSQYAKDVIALNESLKAKKISYADYTKQREALDFKYSQKSLQNTRNQVAQELKQYDGAELILNARQEYLNSLQAKFDSTTDESQKKALSQEITTAQQRVDAAKGMVDKKTGLLKQLNETDKQLSDDATNKDISNQQKRSQKTQEIMGYVIDYLQQVQSLGDGLFDRRASKIEDEMTALEERYGREQELINATYANQEERQAKLAEAEKRYAVQKKALEQQERTEKLKKAQFDKAEAIMSIVLNTAKAVMADTANPLTMWKVPYDIALGAAQLAVAIAAPLPRFFRGKNTGDNYEGYAIVDDGADGRGKAELIVREDGSMEVGSDRPRVTYLNRNDVVYPDARRALEHFKERTVEKSRDRNYFTSSKDHLSEVVYRTMVNSRGALQTVPVIVENDYEVLRDEIRRSGRSIVQAIKGQPRAKTVNIDHMKLWLGSTESADSFIRRMNGH